MGNTTGGLPLLTTKQQRLLQAIQDHVTDHGYLPSIRDLLPIGPWQSTSTVVHHLQALENAGYLTRVPGRNRAIRINTPTT